MVAWMDIVMYICSITSTKELEMSHLNQYDDLMQKVAKNLMGFVFPVEMNNIMHISPNIHMMASLLICRLPFTDSFIGTPFFNMCVYTYLESFNRTIGKWDKAECKQSRKQYHDRFQAFIQFHDNNDGCASVLNQLRSFEVEVNEVLKKNHDKCPICHGLGRHCTQFKIEELTQ